MPDLSFRFVDINDRPMLTVNLDVPHYLETGEWDCPPNLKGAIVRVKGEATESQAEQLAAGGQRLLRAITEKLKESGAHKVIGPKLKIVREKRARSDVTVETSPRAALDRFLVEREVDEDLRPRVLELAEAVMGG
jgi:hypothetical protein